jgi:hypothetical protein
LGETDDLNGTLLASLEITGGNVQVTPKQVRRFKIVALRRTEPPRRRGLGGFRARAG